MSLLPHTLRSGPRRVAYVLSLFSGLGVGLWWALPLESVAHRCPVSGEQGHVYCVLQKQWGAAGTKTVLCILAGHLLGVFLLDRLPGWRARWVGGERPKPVEHGRGRERVAVDPTLSAASWGVPQRRRSAPDIFGADFEWRNAAWVFLLTGGVLLGGAAGWFGSGRGSWLWVGLGALAGAAAGHGVAAALSGWLGPESAPQPRTAVAQRRSAEAATPREPAAPAESSPAVVAPPVAVAPPEEPASPPEPAPPAEPSPAEVVASILAEAASAEPEPPAEPSPAEVVASILAEAAPAEPEPPAELTPLERLLERPRPVGPIEMLLGSDDAPEEEPDADETAADALAALLPPPADQIVEPDTALLRAATWGVTGPEEASADKRASGGNQSPA